jgi:hypothetical protein
MGNWNINIQGMGCHHNENNPTDADRLAAEFVQVLKNAGHTVESANFTYGSKEEITFGKQLRKAAAAAVVVLVGLLAGFSPAVSAPAVEYAAGQWTVAGFASYRAHEFNSLGGRFGGGAEVSYFLKDNVALALESLTEDAGHAALDETGLNLKGFLPIRHTGFAPYGLLGVSHCWEGASRTRATYDKKEGSLTQTTIRDAGDWRFNAGAGVEFRASKTFGVFADGRWTHDFKTLGHALFRVGANLHF